jgi:hypothetical protein
MYGALLEDIYVNPKTGFQEKVVDKPNLQKGQVGRILQVNSENICLMEFNSYYSFEYYDHNIFGQNEEYAAAFIPINLILPLKNDKDIL